MPKHPILRYNADELVKARKIVGRMQWDGRGEKPLRVDIRRTDSPEVAIQLYFEARTPGKGISGVADVRRPSASLLWTGKRIRGIDWTIKHEVTRNGVPTGEVIKGWHEHYWTDEDGSDSIREPKPCPRNQDVNALIDWCCKQWNIEGLPHTMRLFA